MKPGGMGRVMRQRSVEKLHTFVIPAYGESPYLEACIRSLREQRLRSRILMVTSTPNEMISRLAAQYEVPLFVNPGPGGIADDWNFGVQQVKTPLFTIAHQDDVYLADFSLEVLRAYKRVREPILFFTDYWEIRGSRVVRSDRLLNVKRLMLKPLEVPGHWSSVWWRRRVLSMGDPICCPSVTYVKDKVMQAAVPADVAQGELVGKEVGGNDAYGLGRKAAGSEREREVKKNLFLDGLKANLDWQTWERLSKLEGAFVYLRRPLMEHRVHSGSETNRILENHGRGREDLYMFEKFWPEPFAKLIWKVYSTNERSAKA